MELPTIYMEAKGFSDLYRKSAQHSWCHISLYTTLYCTKQLEQLPDHSKGYQQVTVTAHCSFVPIEASKTTTPKSFVYDRLNFICF